MKHDKHHGQSSNLFEIYSFYQIMLQSSIHGQSHDHTEHLLNAPLVVQGGLHNEQK